MSEGFDLLDEDLIDWDAFAKKCLHNSLVEFLEKSDWMHREPEECILKVQEDVDHIQYLMMLKYIDGMGNLFKEFEPPIKIVKEERREDAARNE